jgi:hypothetical protein
VQVAALTPVVEAALALAAAFVVAVGRAVEEEELVLATVLELLVMEELLPEAAAAELLVMEELLMVAEEELLLALKLPPEVEL